MNRTETIVEWRRALALKATTEKGWSVEFAKLKNGAIPALDYLENVDSESDPRFEVSTDHFNRLAGYLRLILSDGPRALRAGQHFEQFIGKDRQHGMCELRVKSNQGHRVLCFMCHPKRFVVSCGFRKPPQASTPPQHKERALAILQEHERERQRRKGL